MIRLFVGLGNPGPEYEATRHNAGFWWLDALAAKLGARLASDRAYQGHVARVAGPQGPVWLLQPMTFMNRSGVSVAGLARFFKIEPQQVLVVHDELDVAPGQAKLKFGGSAAGRCSPASGSLQAAGVQPPGAGAPSAAAGGGM